MKSKELREMNKEELVKFIQEKKAEAVKMRFDVASKQAKDHRDYRDAKKDVARAMTILKEKESK